ncbi:MAG: hypothetical protein PF630_00220 [Gammaproteobacteria bacterium]|jgi:hypothetical protein|nr:hypothetical protein [Gammaproteobacteria bacterium]
MNTNQHNQGDEELANVQFYMSQVNEQAELLNRKFDDLRQDSNQGPEADLILQELLLEFAEIKARLSILEQAAEQNLLQTDPFRHGPLLAGSLHMDIEEFHHAGSYHPLQSNQSGHLYAWSKTTKLNWTLPVSRNTKKTLLLGFDAIIKQDYAKSLKILVDGAVIKHRVTNYQGDMVLKAIIPVANFVGKTTISLELPGVHSPLELGLSDDARTLGIAVSFITVN